MYGLALLMLLMMAFMCVFMVLSIPGAVGDFLGWEIKSIYVFPMIQPGRNGGTPVRGTAEVSTQMMISGALKRYAQEVGETHEFPSHFRSGGWGAHIVMQGQGRMTLDQ